MKFKQIQQQLYTRERGGIFQSNDGYDTIAISPGLDKNFVKKYLHPICFYSIPTELKQRGEKDPKSYPEMTVFIQPETGDLIMGQSVFVPADFTGVRSAFFMHNYIIPSERKEEYLKGPTALFNMQYRKEYSLEEGNVLPEISELQNNSPSNQLERDQLFQVLGLNEDIFKTVLLAVLSSIFSKKKVYITLNVELSAYNQYAQALMALLFSFLPYPARRKLGFLTFSNEPVSKKYIHVVFVEKGSLDFRDRTLDKQYVFDLSNDFISGITVEGEHEYLNFAWDHLVHNKSMKDFHEFCERCLVGLDENVKNDIGTYYQLSVLYQVLQGNHSFYDKNKVGVLQGIYKFYRVDPQKKRELQELYQLLFKREKYAEETIDVRQALTIALNFEKLEQKAVLTAFLINTLHHFRDNEIMEKLWYLIEEYPSSLANILKVFSLQEMEFSELYSRYIHVKYGKLTNIKDILKALEDVVSNTPQLLEHTDFQHVIRKNVISSIRVSDRPMQVIKELRRVLSSLGKRNREFMDFFFSIEQEADEALLKYSKVESITLQDLEDFGRIFIEPSYESNGFRNFRDEQFVILEHLYELFFKPAMSGDFYYKNLYSDGEIRFRNAIKQLIQRNISSNYFPQLFVAFYDNKYRDILFSDLFRFLSKYADAETIYQFIKKTFGEYQRSYEYISALKSYLLWDDSIWQDKNYQMKLKQIRNRDFKKLIKEINYNKANPFVKFFIKNGKFVLLIFTTLLLVVSIGLLVVMLLQSGDNPEKQGDTNEEENIEDGNPLDENENIPVEGPIKDGGEPNEENPNSNGATTGNETGKEEEVKTEEESDSSSKEDLNVPSESNGEE